jgi:hypothetical protein
MEPNGSSPRSQEPLTGPYPETGEIVQTLPSYCLTFSLILSSHLWLVLQSGLFPSVLMPFTKKGKAIPVGDPGL